MDLVVWLWGGIGVELGGCWAHLGCFGDISVLVNSRVMGGDVHCVEVRLGGGKRDGVGGW